MELLEKIDAIEKMLEILGKPPEQIQNCEIVCETVICEKHGEYEQQQTRVNQ